MAKLTWDNAGEKLYETGVDQGVLYVQDTNGTYPKGVAWNGLSSVSESPSGADESAFYADNVKYAALRAAEDYGATVEAYMYPDEWMQCDGSAELADGVFIGQQARKAFGLSYRTLIGNDTEGTAYGYKLHLIYGATASPSEKAYESVNDSPELITFSWEITTTPTAVTGHKPTSCITIDSTKVDKEKLAQLEAKLYGDSSTEASLPSPDEVAAIFA